MEGYSLHKWRDINLSIIDYIGITTNRISIVDPINPQHVQKVFDIFQVPNKK